MSSDYDSPWKEALDGYFEPFLTLLFPQVHRRIDWSRGYESLGGCVSARDRENARGETYAVHYEY